MLIARGAWRTAPLVGAIVLLALVPACGSPSSPVAVTTSTSGSTTSTTSTTSSAVLPEQQPAEIAACTADAKTVEVALDAYMAEKGAYPAPPSPWSAATYAANFEPLTSTGGGGPYMQQPPSTRFYVIEYDSSGHVWVAPPGSYQSTYNAGQSVEATACQAAVG